MTINQNEKKKRDNQDLILTVIKNNPNLKYTKIKEKVKPDIKSDRTISKYLNKLKEERAIIQKDDGRYILSEKYIYNPEVKSDLVFKVILTSSVLDDYQRDRNMMSELEELEKSQAYKTSLYHVLDKHLNDKILNSNSEEDMKFYYHLKKKIEDNLFYPIKHDDLNELPDSLKNNILKEIDEFLSMSSKEIYDEYLNRWIKPRSVTKYVKAKRGSMKLGYLENYGDIYGHPD